MTSRPLPLVLTLAAALAVAGCARDAQVPVAANADTAPATAAQAGPPGPPEAQTHDQAHAGVDADVPVPDGHEPWTPDAPLVEGMSRVRAAATALEATPAPAVAGQIAQVDEAIAYIFANCRLDPEPDAALHGVLARLMAASQALQADPADASAVASMRAAVANYEALFDDPNS